jgi:hypothetical protein
MSANDCKDINLFDDLYNRNNVEYEYPDGLEYFNVQSLENFILPSTEEFYDWPSGLNVKFKYLCLSSRGFEVPLEWDSDEHEGRSLIEGAYFLAKKLPLLALLSVAHRTKMWSRDTVIRALRVYNTQVDEIVRIDSEGGTVFRSLRAMMSREYTEYEGEPGIEKDDMHMLVDKICGRFVAKD